MKKKQKSKTWLLNQVPVGTQTLPLSAWTFWAALKRRRARSNLSAADRRLRSPRLFREDSSASAPGRPKGSKSWVSC